MSQTNGTTFGEMQKAGHSLPVACSCYTNGQREITNAGVAGHEPDLKILAEKGPVAMEAMRYLLKAHDYAHELGVNAWDFAVEIDFLRRLDIGVNELRWLVGSGWMEQAEETTAAGDDRRKFSPSGFLKFDAQTCFVLTERGVTVARYVNEQWVNEQWVNEQWVNKQAVNKQSVNKQSVNEHRVNELRPTLESVSAGEVVLSASGRQIVEKPRWIADRQRLYLGDDLVKEFKLPSPNQIAILSAFEEEEWPPHVDDPLPMCSSVGPKERLRYTIKSLNKHQKKQKIRFRGDGRGEGICWEVWAQEAGL